MYRDRRKKKEEREIISNNPETYPESDIIKEDNNEDSAQEEDIKNNREINPNEIKDDEIPEDDTKYNSNKKNNNMSDNIYKAKSRDIEENKETSEFNVNKKLRNTMTGLNNSKMKYESGLIDMILKVEKDNVNHYLKGDLAEMYNDINRNNSKFKNDIFLANIDNFEKKTGTLDKRPIIPYNCSEDISFKLDSFPKTNEIIDKFSERAKFFKGYD